MSKVNCPMPAKETLEKYFLDNRARLLEIASFLDRIDRYENAASAISDFRYQSFLKALAILIGSEKERTKKIQILLSDLSEKPVEHVRDFKAYGAWRGASHEGD